MRLIRRPAIAASPPEEYKAPQVSDLVSAARAQSTVAGRAPGRSAQRNPSRQSCPAGFSFPGCFPEEDRV